MRRRHAVGALQIRAPHMIRVDAAEVQELRTALGIAQREAEEWRRIALDYSENLREVLSGGALADYQRSVRNVVVVAFVVAGFTYIFIYRNYMM